MLKVPPCIKAILALCVGPSNLEGLILHTQEQRWPSSWLQHEKDLLPSSVLLLTSRNTYNPKLCLILKCAIGTTLNGLLVLGMNFTLTQRNLFQSMHPSLLGIVSKSICSVMPHMRQIFSLVDQPLELSFINGSPIKWYSKCQNTIESSTFGSEFVALTIATEMHEAICYKLRMFGIPIDGPTNTFCDNASVVNNVTRPESVLQKKHNSIAYLKVRESVAASALRVKHGPGTSNLADVLTKWLPHIKHMFSCMMWR